MDGLEVTNNIGEAETGECEESKVYEEETKEEESQKGFEDEMLVALIKEYRVLWDFNNKSYRDKEARKEAWMDIGNTLNTDVETIKRRWKNLRDGMVRCLKKLDHSMMSGAGYLKTPMCRLFNQLLFLKDSIQSHNNTTINLSDIDDLSSYGGDGSVRKRPRSSIDHALSNSYIALTNGSEKESSDWLFCKSLVGIFEKMPSKQNRLARIEVMQVLMKYEFEDTPCEELVEVQAVVEE